MKTIVSRYIDGISLNGTEQLLQENGDLMTFSDKNKAIAFLQSHFPDSTLEDIEDCFIFEEISEEKK